MNKLPGDIALRGKKELKPQLERWLALDELVTTVASQFFNYSGEIDEKIPGSLQAIADQMGTVCSFLVLFSDDPASTNPELEWFANNQAPLHTYLKQLIINNSKSLFTRLKRLEEVTLPCIAVAPYDAISEKKIWQASEIESVVCIPLTSGEKLAGFLGFGSDTSPSKVTKKEIRMIRFLGEVLVNVLKRRRMEEALSESEERYRSLFEHLPIGFYRTTLDGQILDANPAMIDMLGYPDRKTLLAAKVEDIFWKPLDRASQHSLLERDEVIRQYEIEMKCYDGRSIWVRDTARAIRGSAGQTLCYEGSLEDITASKRIEVESHNSEVKFQTIFDLSPYGIALLDLNGNIMDCNLETVAMQNDTSKQELVGKSIRSLLAPKDHEKAMETLKRTLEHGSVKNCECVLVKKDGSGFPAELSYSLIRDTSGNPSYIIMMINDTTARNRAEETLKETQKQLAQQVGELRSRAREIETLTEMVNMLQICGQLTEAYAVVEKHGFQLFPTSSGAMLILDQTSGIMEPRAKWGNPSIKEGLFTRDDCWALRRGRAYMLRDLESGPHCAHIGDRLPSSYLCTPIIAQGIAIGLLYLEAAPGSLSIGDPDQQLAAAVAEQAGLAFSNLRLRENLREQAIRDPLTGLYNRYYMEESLDRELNRADRSGKPVGVIMLDLDHFKDLNTRFGHPNVDVMLQEFGKMLQASIRSGDIACRYGGDEFLLILPEASIEVTQDRAEQLRQQVKKLTVRSGDLVYDRMTISVGVACWPQHGPTTSDILKTVDAALLSAKLTHDCVITASS